MNSYEGLRKKKSILPCNHMSAVFETSFFRPKNVGLSILNWGGRLTWTEQLTDCGLKPLRNEIRFNDLQSEKEK